MKPWYHGSPLVSVSLGELWGRRWNTAFRDLTHRFLFRPLTARFGARSGLFVGFAFSGIVHDMVISLPAGGGYGGPSIFFILPSTRFRSRPTPHHAPSTGGAGRFSGQAAKLRR